MYRELLSEGAYDSATEYAQLLAFAKAEFEEEVAKEVDTVEGTEEAGRKVESLQVQGEGRPGNGSGQQLHPGQDGALVRTAGIHIREGRSQIQRRERQILHQRKAAQTAGKDREMENRTEEQSRRTGRRIPHGKAEEARRRRQRRRIIRKAKQIALIVAARAVFVLIAFGLVKGVMAIACTVFGEPKDVSVVEAAPEPEESQEAETQPVEIMTPEEVDANQMAKYGCKIYGSYGYPWNRMSQDWDNIEGFYYHDISTAAKQAGGEFPVIAQIYTYIVCRDAGVDYETVFALIEKESGCVWDAIGDSGESVGLMQINERWHRDRMRKERCTDLMNPYMNIRVGVSYLAELYEVTGNVADMLTAYNYGLQGARENMWSRGIHDYPYNEEIMQRAAELKAETAAARKRWEERNKE